MKLAIMQPYFFPYLGYWQLINSVDRFVIYDDVNFIQRGWINRNRILINGQPSYITIPLLRASQNRKICDISVEAAPVWRRKMISSIEHAYRKAPFFSAVFPEIERLIRCDDSSLSGLLSRQLIDTARFLGIGTEFVTSSGRYGNGDLAGQDRILDICEREGATCYVNLPGGQQLYDSEVFRRSRVDLRFVTVDISPYRQRSADFVPNLSIIDALMEIGVEGVRKCLAEAELTAAAGGITGYSAGH